MPELVISICDLIDGVKNIRTSKIQTSLNCYDVRGKAKIKSIKC